MQFNGGWSTTGFSQLRGTRQSLTYNLKPGQYRGMGKPHIFKSNTYIQNNYYGSNISDHFHCCDYAQDFYDNTSGGSKWSTILCSIAAGIPFLTNIMDILSPKKAEGAGDSAEPAATAEDPTLKSFQKIYEGQCTIVKISDNRYIVKPKDGLPQEVSELNVDIINGVLGKKEEPETATRTEEEVVEDAEQAAAGNGGRAEAVNTEKPNLFQKMDVFESAEAVLTAFKNATKTEAYSIKDAITAGSITINTVQDHGNSTSKNIGPITITAEHLQTLQSLPAGKKINIDTDKDGRAVMAENLDGYIRITAGPDEQTYIIGKDEVAHQYSYDNNIGNVNGYREVNWRGTATHTRVNNVENLNNRKNKATPTDSNVNTKSYSFTDKLGKTWTIKYNSETQEESYFDSDGNQVETEVFKSFTGIKKLDFMPDRTVIPDAPEYYTNTVRNLHERVRGNHNFNILGY